MSTANSDTAPESVLESVRTLIRTDLVPHVGEIDQQGVYPEAFLHALGRLGGYDACIALNQDGTARGLTAQIEITSAVGQQCGSTAFLVWCQSVCAWYLSKTPNERTRQRFLKPVADGEILCGTGMSNTVKHLAGIEKLHLKARREDGHYVIDGILPWVSNFGIAHAVIVTAQLVNTGGYVMFLLRDDAEGVSLHPCPSFSGMEGTSTFNVRFKNVLIDDSAVVAHPDQFEKFIYRIKPGFILGQAGMAFGLIEASLKTIRKSNITHSHVNVFLDDQEMELANELSALQAQAAVLAAQSQVGDTPVLAVLKLRARLSELTTRAVQSAALHAGARGYQMRHPAQRRLREAVFVSIVTPALKHLRKEIHDIETATAGRMCAAEVL